MLLDISDDAVYTALTGFFRLFLPLGTVIVRGQQNRMPEPNVDCVVMTTLGAPRRVGTNADSLETVVVNNQITGFTASAKADFEYSVQADFYSQYAESWAIATELAWRDDIGIDVMPEGITPLYSEGRQQLPLLSGENQWVQRWTMTLVLDYRPTLTVTTQAATFANVVAIPVDVKFPPA